MPTIEDLEGKLPVSPCTREDVADVVSRHVELLQKRIDRMESTLQRLVTTCCSHGSSLQSSGPLGNLFTALPGGVPEGAVFSIEGNASCPSGSVRDDAMAEGWSARNLAEAEKVSDAHVVRTDDGEYRSAAAEFVEELELEQDMIDGGFTDHIAFNSRFLFGLRRCVIWWDDLQEPPRTGYLHAVVTSNVFQFMCTMVIVLNSAFVAYTADWEMKHLGREPSASVKHADIAFLGAHVLEVSMRLAVHRFYFFINEDMKWNLFDFVLCSLSVLDGLRMLLMDTGSGNQIVFMRALRLCKMAKVVRLFRAFRFFKDLGIMMDGFRSTMVPLFWSVVMIIILLYVFAVLFLQTMAAFLVNGKDTVDPALKREVQNMFGSMGLSLFTLYSAVTGGNDWSEVYHVIKHAGHAYAVLFCFVIFFFTFAVFNVLMAMFVERAAVAASPDREQRVLDKRRQAREDAMEFRQLCLVMDTENKGVITWSDFQKFMQNKAMVLFLASVGLEVYEIEMFFHVVAGGVEREVSIDRFVEGCMHMKGHATGIDMQRQLYEVAMLNGEVKTLGNATLGALQECLVNVRAISTSIISTRADPFSLDE